MGFSEFHGNVETVGKIREMLARGRFPHAVILAGPPGSGKYTLATMIAQALNCSTQPRSDGLLDFCGACPNCVRIGLAKDLNTLCAEAAEAREALKESEKKETRLFVQTHPDVLVIPPDPPQMMIKVDQVRRVIESIYFRPAEGRERVFIFTDGLFIKEAANALLKVLEEPPQYATIFLLARSPSDLLSTIRSRSMVIFLKNLSGEEIARYLANHRPQWSEPERALVARVSEGALGRALAFDLAGYSAARADALTILRTTLLSGQHTELFKVTETYHAGADGRAKTERLLHCLYSLLEDLLFLDSGSQDLVRNRDLIGELRRLGANVDFEWLATASERLVEVERGLRRNLLRSLSIDGFAAALERN